jgi:hypothetical protein
MALLFGDLPWVEQVELRLARRPQTAQVDDSADPGSAGAGGESFRRGPVGGLERGA